MENIIFTIWDVVDTLVQIGIYLAIVMAGQRIVRVLWAIQKTLEDIGAVIERKN